MQDQPNKKAYNYLLKILSIKDYPKNKLQSKLISKGFSEDETIIAIDTAIHKKVYDEDNYTKGFIRSHMNKGYSPDYIKSKLQQNSINLNSSFINQVFEENNITTQMQIDSILKTKIPPKIEGLNKEIQIKSINKAYRFLASKGHTIDIYEYFSFLNF